MRIIFLLLIFVLYAESALAFNYSFSFSYLKVTDDGEITWSYYLPFGSDSYLLASGDKYQVSSE